MNHNATHIDVDFSVPFTHRVRFTQDVLGPDHRTLIDLLEPSGAGPARAQFWVDQQLLEAQPDLRHRLHQLTESQRDRLVQVGNVQVVPGGEAIKNDIHIIERMLKCMNAADLDRRSYVVVIGGGAVLDAVGFAAAIAHRGIRLVRLPTTTLAQADSAIGVKNSINLFDKKNWVGTFAVPWAVVNDAALLTTLSDRDYRCGFSEAVKVSMLKDAAMFDELCRVAPRIADRDPAASSDMIRRSALWHLQHITRGGDPFEALEARPLDFGHWSAHKLEVMSNFAVRHGEAVGIGVAIDCMYSSLALGLDAATVERVLNCLLDLRLPIDHPMLHETDRLFAGMEEFRQHLGGRLTLTMVRAPGEPVDVHAVDAAAMREAIEAVAAFARTHAR
ncbi:MAG: 3-dehydroquinate synthase [Planctomycetes bacterium]|nr:3-dehydroquinate synthase [Planctomycetota bacterium]